MHVAFEANVGNDFLNDYTTNSPRLGVPFNVVTALEHFSHRAATILSKSRVIIQARSMTARGSVPCLVRGVLLISLKGNFGPDLFAHRRLSGLRNVPC